MDRRSADGYTITIHNSNSDAVVVNTITDTLPAGFTYTPGSTTGATTSDPTVSGQNLTWSGPFNDPAGGDVTLHFGVTVSSTAGTYYNNAGGSAETTAVAQTGDTAPITVQGGDEPIAASGTTFSATEGAGFSGTVATFDDADPAGMVSDYTATIDWGDGLPTSSGTITQPGGPGHDVPRRRLARLPPDLRHLPHGPHHGRRRRRRIDGDDDLQRERSRLPSTLTVMPCRSRRLEGQPSLSAGSADVIARGPGRRLHGHDRLGRRLDFARRVSGWRGTFAVAGATRTPRRVLHDRRDGRRRRRQHDRGHGRRLRRRRAAPTAVHATATRT